MLQDLASLCNSDLVRTYSVYSIFVCFDTMVHLYIYTTLYIVVYSATGWTCLSLHGCVSFVFRICQNVITDATVLVEGVFWPAPLNQPAVNSELQRLSCLYYVDWRIPMALLLSCSITLI